MQSRRQSQFGWQPWATRCPHVPNVSIQRVFWNVSIFRRRSMISWDPCFILYSWQVVKQWHVPNVATGKVFRWRTPISGLLFKDYLRRADVPETDPIRLPYKHIYITWYEKRRGEAAKGTVCKSGNKRYRRVRSNWHLEIASIQWWNFFLLPPVTGYCWFLSGCRTMRCSAVNQPLIKLAVLLSPQEDSRDKRCLWEVLMKRLWNIWYQLLYSTTLLRILHYLWLDMLFAFGTLATVHL